MQEKAIVFARAIFESATPVIRIHGVGGRRWKRNVAKGSRIGPWLQGEYDLVNEKVWREQGPCLYLVAGDDQVIRYVGISRNGLKHRWRTSPAYDAQTMERLPKNQLFHSQCWKHIEAESSRHPGRAFEVRSIAAESLLPVLAELGAPLSAFTVLADDGESVVAAVERWLCNHQSAKLVSWNVAMTGA
jgi:hypothetical protein